MEGDRILLHPWNSQALTVEAGLDRELDHSYDLQHFSRSARTQRSTPSAPASSGPSVLSPVGTSREVSGGCGADVSLTLPLLCA